MKKEAYISQDGRYRYMLSRIWDETKPLVMFIGLNPSTADVSIVEDPIGPENDEYLKKMAMSAALIVAAWGNSGKLQNRSQVVAEMFPEMKCLRQNKTGEPTHPLYLPADLKPINFKE